MVDKNVKHLLGAGLLFAVLMGNIAVAAPITFNTALPVSDEEIIIRQQIIYSGASDNILGVSRDLDIWKSVTALGYGINENLAIFTVVPIINRNMKTGNLSTNASGLADIKTFVRYQIYQNDGPGKTTRMAGFGGVNIPTGKTGETSDGSTDFFGGIILTRASTNWNFDGQIKYTANGQKNAFKRGNESAFDASLQYRINNYNGNVNTTGYLYTVLEASLVYADRNEVANLADVNSGGTTAFLTPGLQYATKRWIAETAIKIPVVKQLNGTALQPGVTVIASMRFNF